MKLIYLINLGLNFIRLLNPIAYKVNGSETPRNRFGFLASNIEEIVEELDIKDSSFISYPDYKDYEDKEDKPLKFVSHDQVWTVLLNAVKELDAKVQELEAKLDEK